MNKGSSIAEEIDREYKARKAFEESRKNNEEYKKCKLNKMCEEEVEDESKNRF